MGSTHAHAYQQIDGATLAGIVDPFEKGRIVAARLNVPHFQSVEDVNPADFDIVDVCVPTFLHRRYVEWAASIGKNVFCEKPIALTVEDAMAMVRACDEAGVRLTIGHCVRFFPEYEVAKRTIDQGKIGHVAVARVFRGGSHPTPHTWNDWYANRAQSGGVMVDLMIHDFDFLRWTFGPVTRVFAKTIRHESNRIGLALVTLRFQNGTIAHVEGSWAHEGFGTRYEFAGAKGLLAHDSFKANSVRVDVHASGASEGPSVQVPHSPLHKSAYQLEIEDFLDALKSDRAFRVSPEDAIEALRISLAAVESAESGRPVNIAQEEPDPTDVDQIDLDQLRGRTR